MSKLFEVEEIRMKKQFIVAGMIVVLLVVGLSGCTDFPDYDGDGNGDDGDNGGDGGNGGDNGYDTDDWVIETVDSPTSSGTSVGTYSSIDIDSAAKPHIAYYSYQDGDLKYAKQITPNHWETETADSNGSVGRYVSMDLDLDDNAHIAYYYHGFNYNGKAMYAHWDGSSWMVETIDEGGDIGYYTSIAVDTYYYTPHVAYMDGTNYLLKYAKRTGPGSWDITTIDTLEGYADISIALDSNNYPHIAYYDSYNRHLRYARYDGNVWHTEVVDSEDAVGDYCSIALDEDDDVHIAYNDLVYSAMKYATAPIGTSLWDIQQASQVGDGGDGHYTSIDIGPYDKVHISHWDYFDSQLKYTYYDGALWYTKTVANNVDHDTSIAVDPYGTPYISYYDTGDNSLKCAYLT